MTQGLAALVVLLLLLSATSCAPAADGFSPEAIIALERRALDRWGKGDPQGFLDIMAEDETYFDPLTEKRIDGLESLRKYFAPLAGKIHIDRVEMIDPKVFRNGDLAVLTFNLADYGGSFNGGPKSTSRWNSTEVFRRIDGKWRIVHSHWSYTEPELKAGG